MGEADEVFAYLSKHPTEADILAMVYEVKPKLDFDLARQILGPKREVDEQAFNATAEYFNSPMIGVPAEVRDGMKFAEDKIAQMRLKTKKADTN